LRRREVDHRDAALDGRNDILGQCRARFGYPVEQRVEHRTGLFCRDVANDGHEGPVAHHGVAERLHQIVPGQRRNAVEGAVEVAAIGVVAKGHAVEGLAGDIALVLGTRADIGQNLRPHPLDSRLVKAWLGQRLVQQGDGLIPVLRQELCRHRHRVVEHIIAKTCGQSLARGLKGLGIQIARALFNKRGHQVHRAALARTVKARPALKQDFHGDEGNFVALHQPGLDAAGRGDFSHLDLGLGGHGPGSGRQGDHGRQNGADHWVISSDGAGAVT